MSENTKYSNRGYSYTVTYKGLLSSLHFSIHKKGNQNLSVNEKVESSDEGKFTRFSGCGWHRVSHSRTPRFEWKSNERVAGIGK